MENLSQPSVFGPGIWLLIHKYGFLAINEEKKKDCINFINNLTIILPCKICRDELIHYIRDNPFRHCWEMKEGGREIGLFLWGWRLHNHVNTRLGKPTITFEDALEMYSKECQSCELGKIIYTEIESLRNVEPKFTLSKILRRIE